MKLNEKRRRTMTETRRERDRINEVANDAFASYVVEAAQSAEKKR